MGAIKRTTLKLMAVGALVTLFVTPVLGAETTGRASSSGDIEGGANQSLLAPPFTDLPWMAVPGGQVATADGLFGSKIDTLGPFLLEPNLPPTQFSASWPRVRPENPRP